MVLYRSVTVVSLMFCMGSPTPPPTPHTDFGCLFSEKDSFQLKYLPLVNNTWGPDAVYGRAVPPIEIEEKDLDDFKAYIEFVKRNILRNNVFDEANYYARLYINTRVRRVRNPEMLIDTLLEFYQSPMKERHDNLGLIMKVFTDIRSGEVVDPEQINMAEKIKGWAEALKTQALYIAAVSTSELGLSYDYFARKRSQEVLPDSKINAIVGVIKIKHMNDTGYMIVDMKRALTPLPLIWTNTQSASTQYVASPPDRAPSGEPRDDSVIRQRSPAPPPPPNRNGQLSKQGSLTIVRRSSTKKSLTRGSSLCSVDDESLDSVDLATDNLPAVDTPDACDKAALRLRCLLRQLKKGEISADLLQRNLHYAAKVLEAVFIDETKEPKIFDEALHRLNPVENVTKPSLGPTVPKQKRRLRTPVWARRLADEDDELSEVQPDAVPPEVREWLASTFTRQLATTRRKADEKPKFRSVAHAIRAGIFVDRIYRKVTNTALMQFPPDVVRVLKTLDEWSFDVFALSESGTSQPIKYLGYDLLNRYGIFHKFKVPPATLENFLVRIEEGYCRHRNPYHNNLHAADVAQTIHYMLCQTGLMNWMTDLEIFATLVAALIHDYEHTGTTNNFHVMAGTDTAMLYNDRAVLENHHVSASFRVLKEDDCNILQNLSKEEFREFRTLVIDMVLATDMSFHFQQLKNMRNLLTLAEPSVDKSKALSLVLHCCDIAHPSKRWDLHHRWTSLLLEEFFRQGDKERELGLPFSPLCDRNNTLVAESQIGFIEFIVEPSMAVCSDMLETILGPINAPTPADVAPLSISEQTDSSKAKDGLNLNCDVQAMKYSIPKPWVGCLVENKKRWKEQALKDAESRTTQNDSSDSPSSPHHS